MTRLLIAMAALGLAAGLYFAASSRSAVAETTRPRAGAAPPAPPAPPTSPAPGLDGPMQSRGATAQRDPGHRAVSLEIQVHGQLDVRVNGRVRWILRGPWPFAGFQESKLNDGHAVLPRPGSYYLVVEPLLGALPFRGEVFVEPGATVVLPPSGELRLALELQAGAQTPEDVGILPASAVGEGIGQGSGRDALALQRARTDAYWARLGEVEGSLGGHTCAEVVDALLAIDAAFAADVPRALLLAGTNSGPRLDPARQLVVWAAAPSGEPLCIVVDTPQTVRFVDPPAASASPVSAPIVVDPRVGAEARAVVSRTLVFGQLVVEPGAAATEVRVVLSRKEPGEWQFHELEGVQVELQPDLSFVAENVPPGTYVAAASWLAAGDLFLASAPVEVVEGQFNDAGPLQPGPASVRVETSFDLAGSSVEPEDVLVHDRDCLLVQYRPTFEELQLNRLDRWIAIQARVPFGAPFRVRGLWPGSWTFLLTGGAAVPAPPEASWSSSAVQVDVHPSTEPVEAKLTYGLLGDG